MRAWLAALALAAAGAVAAPLTAETVAIRSGEHPDFTRLVLSMPAGTEWHIGRDGGSYVLDLGAGLDFDVSEIFGRIPRDRIADARNLGAGRLELRLGCDICHAALFLWQADKLVLDIKDGPAAPDAAAERPLAPVHAVAAPPLNLPVILPAPAPQATLLPFRTRPTAPHLSAADAARIARTEQQINQSLARAATLGLVDLAPGPEAAAAHPPPLTASDPLGIEAIEGQPGLAYRTSLDRGDESDAPVEHDLCLPDELFDIETWAPEGEDFSHSIAQYRAALTAEFDAYPPGASLTLARGYLHFGFGAEAAMALRLEGGNSVERRVLGALAQIVDGMPVTEGIFTGQTTCPGAVALWAALARGSVEGIGDEGLSALMLSFRTLPEPLKGHLGTRLAQLFLEAGDLVTAEAMQRSSLPEVTGESAAAVLTGVEITEQVQGPEAALMELESLVRDSATLTTDSLLRLIDLSLSLGKPPSDAIIALTASQRFQERGNAVAGDLADAEARALIAAGRWEEAISLTDQQITGFDEARKQALRDAAITALTTGADDLRFLDHALVALPQGVTAKTENLVAARLIEMDFPDRAVHLLNGADQAEDAAERRYLRAGAALALNDLDGVMTALEGMRDARALALIARAEGRAGNWAAALAADPAPESAALWRAGAWDRLQSEGTDPQLAAAAAQLLTPADDGITGPPLAERRALLARADETRAMVDELLGRFTVDEGE